MTKNLRLMSSATIRIDEELLEKMKFISEKSNRSLNRQIVYEIIKIISEYEKENGEIIIDLDKKYE